MISAQGPRRATVRAGPRGIIGWLDLPGCDLSCS